MRTIRALRRSLSSTGLRLLLLVLVAASPVLVVRAVSFRTDRQAVREHSGDQVLLIARLAAAQQRSLVSQAQKLAIAMAGSIEARSDPVTCGRWLAELLERNPSFASFGIARPTGEVWCSGRPAPTTVSIADRPYFQEALRTGDVAIGEYQVSRTAGIPSLNVGVPVRDGANTIVGVAFAGIDLRSLVQLVEAADPPAGHTMTLVDRSDRILVRYPDPERWAGTPAPSGDLVRRALAANGTAKLEFTGLDGVERLHGAVRLEQNGDPYAYVTVGIPSDDVYGLIDQSLVRGVIASAVGLLLAVLVVLTGVHVFITRPTNRLLAAARRIGGGDFVTDPGRGYQEGEFGELEHAVDAMAATLRARDVERARQHRLEAEFEQVAEMQASVLPSTLHLAEGFELAARCLPARRVGGDFYDWWEDSTGTLHIVLGDVMGKGMQAAPLMAGARAALRVASQYGSPEIVLQSIEPALIDDFELTDSFITLFYAQYVAATGRLTYADAGHGLGFVVEADGRVQRLPSQAVPLGAFGRSAYEHQELTLGEGATLVVTSDGLLDEYPALLREPAVVLAPFSHGATAEAIDALFASGAHRERDDDLTVIAIRRLRVGAMRAADTTVRRT